MWPKCERRGRPSRPPARVFGRRSGWRADRVRRDGGRRCPCSRFCRVAAAHRERAPSSPRRFAIARPRPVPPPVTIATLILSAATTVNIVEITGRRGQCPRQVLRLQRWTVEFEAARLACAAVGNRVRHATIQRCRDRTAAGTKQCAGVLRPCRRPGAGVRKCRLRRCSVHAAARA